ncbi:MULTISPECIES: acetolactate synthase 2 small subunit [Marinobacter]|uniref:acetolactate synthase 2 small subunit n=1 Tax=Marinobacter TaxID=2742 RepID=UPI001D0753F1|nr:MULTISPECIES: acetolactate synthase 2 small subunit [Marinobacter]MCK7567223.1 acetolactate synthase 2 small subunit [Marinobacter xestospongiae]UDL04073.1 acetolactate synthase 2 small subunit [Marinobacter sp. CA1]
MSATTEHTLTCRMQAEPAALERLCQVVRVRGFRIRQMSADSADGQLTIGLTVSGERPIGMLQSQLEKLHTVAQVSTETTLALARA